MKNLIKTTVAILLLLLISINIFVVSATEAVADEETEAWRKKIDDGLWEIMSGMADDELVDVLITITSVKRADVVDACAAELGDGYYSYYYHYEDEYIPKLIEDTEKKLGLAPGTLDKFSPEIWEVHEETGYSIAYTKKRMEMQSAVNKAFIEKHVPAERHEFLTLRSVGFIGVDATVSEIIYYAKLDEVFDVTLWEEGEEDNGDPVIGSGGSIANGDVNGDGKVDSLDAAWILKYDAEIITEFSNDNYQPITEFDILGNVNEDFKVDSLDAACILKYDAGLVE